MEENFAALRVKKPAQFIAVQPIRPGSTMDYIEQYKNTPLTLPKLPAHYIETIRSENGQVVSLASRFGIPARPRRLVLGFLFVLFY